MSYMQTSHIQNETRTNILTFSSYSNAHNGLIKTDHILPEQVDMQAYFNHKSTINYNNSLITCNIL
jgi:hypothetical protein